MYNAYHLIHDFLENPFSAGDRAIPVFNAGRFLVQHFERCELEHSMNRANVYFALAKVAMALEAFKTARQCYEKLADLFVPPHLEAEVELSQLLIRSKPFQDSE